MGERSFDAIYEQYSKMVYFSAYSIVKSESDAMDITQDVFLRVLKHEKKLSEMDDNYLKNWLYRVTVNRCMDNRRFLKREAPSDELPESYVYNESELPEAAALTNEQKRIVKEAIDALPDIYRECVILHYYSNLRYEEIAAFLGVSEGTIKSRMSRAKDRLSVLLKGGEQA